MSVEPVFQFVDTNVLVYAYDRSAGSKYKKASSLIQALWEKKTGCLSIQVLQEFYVTVTRKVAKPLGSEAASQILADLSVWRIHSPTAADLLDAVRIERLYAISFWDAMIIQSASRLGCKTIWSEDLNPGQSYNEIVVNNPFTAT
jgi:predicted nucleic acid-binding protein